MSDPSLTRELLSYLISAAAQLSGYPPIEVGALPPVRIVSAEAFAVRVCPQAPQECRGIAATFESQRYEILVRDSLDLEQAADNSFLLHEFVHVLQWKARGEAIFDGCPQTLRTETEAYRVQNAYLKREGQFPRFGEALMFTTCAAEAGNGPPRGLMSVQHAGD